MARLFELVFAAFLIYLAYRRVAAPFQRGYQEREQERRKAREFRNAQTAPTPPKLDRTSVRDAEFKDLV